MNKLLIHFSIAVSIFFGAFLLLSQIDFVKKMGVEELNKSKEKKLGEIMIDLVKKNDKEILNDSVVSKIEAIKDRLCKKNGLKADEIKLHVFYNSQVNAFAMPDKHMVVYTGLIENCKNPEELSGVMAHELAHMQHDHVMKKMAKEVGLSVLAALAAGDAGSEILKEALKLLTSSAFDREQESEADATAVTYMAKADMDPKYLADFLFRISLSGTDIPKQLNWISTHPDSKDRAGEILNLRKKEKYITVPIMTAEEWAKLQESVKYLDEDEEVN